MEVKIGPYPSDDDIVDEQFVSVRIDSYDTWSMDCTLAHIVIPMLKQLKATKHGAPYVDMEDRPEHLKCEKVKYDTDEHHFSAWDWAMDEMIFAFESKLNDWEEQFWSGEVDRICVPVDEDGNEVPEEEAYLYRWDEGPNNTFEIDIEGRNAYQDRISNGFRLFGKYYECLWD